MNNTTLLVGALVLAAGAYVYVNRSRAAATAAATAPANPGAAPSFWDRALAAAGAGLSSYAQSGQQVAYRSSGTTATRIGLDRDLGDLNTVDSFIS